jgi:hypothetical protein
MLRIQKILVTLTSGLALVALSLGAAPHAAQADEARRKAPSVVLTPNPVAMGSMLTVKISGYPASTKLAVTQCSDGKGTCDVVRVLTPRTNASGAVTVKYKVHAFKSCKKGKSCYMGVATLEGNKPVGKVQLFRIKS